MQNVKLFSLPYNIINFQTYPAGSGHARWLRGGGPASRCLEMMTNNYVVVKLDFSTAFSSLHRSDMLKSIADQVSKLLPFCYSAYENASVLYYGQYPIVLCSFVIPSTHCWNRLVQFSGSDTWMAIGLCTFAQLHNKFPIGYNGTFQIKPRTAPYS